MSMEDMSTSSDAELAEAMRSSNAAAFKTFYYRYHDSIASFLYHRTYSAELTKDFVQEVFTRIWQTREKIDVTKSIKAYLYRIAKNLVIDYFRKNSSRKSYITTQTRRKQLSSQASIEMQTSINIAINKLPEKLRTVFMLSRYDGLKYVEIAEVCQVSVKTVESRMSRALNFLRKEL